MLAVGRPEDALRIGVVRFTIVTENELRATLFFAQMQVVVLDENGPFAVGRAGTRGPAGPSPRRIVILLRRFGVWDRFVLGERVRFAIALPAFFPDPEAETLLPLWEIEIVDRQMRAAVFLARGFRQRGGQASMIEGRSSFTFDRIDEDVFPCPADEVVAIPEPLVVRQPVRLDAVLENLVARQRAEAVRALVIGRRSLSGRR